ncbi:hypothetical protein D3C81_1561780 [compost metagenome]
MFNPIGNCQAYSPALELLPANAGDQTNGSGKSRGSLLFNCAAVRIGAEFGDSHSNRT